MGLRLKANSDDFLPYTKFNAKDGHWYSKDDAGSQFQVKEMTASVDLENIKVGWICFEQDAAPDAVWDVNGCEAPQPSPQHKRGFSVRMYSPKNLGGLREFMSNSSAVNAAMVELYSAFEDAPERRQGLVPVVRCEGVLPIKSRHGQNYRPVLRIVKWVERPDGLNGAGGPKQAAPEETTAPLGAAGKTRTIADWLGNVRRRSTRILRLIDGGRVLAPAILPRSRQRRDNNP